MTDKSFEDFNDWWDGKRSDNDWKRAFERMVEEAKESEEESE